MAVNSNSLIAWRYENIISRCSVSLAIGSIGSTDVSSSLIYRLSWCIGVVRGELWVGRNYPRPSNIFLRYVRQENLKIFCYWSMSNPLNIVSVWRSFRGCCSFSCIRANILLTISSFSAATAKSSTCRRRKIRKHQCYRYKGKARASCMWN